MGSKVFPTAARTAELCICNHFLVMPDSAGACTDAHSLVMYFICPMPVHKCAVDGDLLGVALGGYVCLPFLQTKGLHRTHAVVWHLLACSFDI